MSNNETFDYEKLAKNEYYTVSDGTQLLVRHHTPAEKKYELVFVAGLGTQVYSWRHVLQYLSEDHEIFYIETREKPSSKIAKKDFTPQRFMDDVTEVIEQLPISKNYYTIGSSMGSVILLGLLGHHRINPLFSILVGPAPEIKVSRAVRLLLPLFSKRMYRFTSPIIQWYIVNFKTNKKEEPEQAQKYKKAIREADPEKLRDTLYAWRGFSVWDLLPNIQGKTYLIGASKDKLHDVNLTKSIAERVPNASYVDLRSNKESHDYPLVELIRNEIFPSLNM